MYINQILYSFCQLNVKRLHQSQFTIFSKFIILKVEEPTNFNMEMENSIHNLRYQLHSFRKIFLESKQAQCFIFRIHRRHQITIRQRQKETTSNRRTNVRLQAGEFVRFPSVVTNWCWALGTYFRCYFRLFAFLLLVLCLVICTLRSEITFR